MINYTERLDAAIRKSAWAHHHNTDTQKQYRKGTDIPYIIHPVGVMMIASNATDDEDTLIACLMHDILEDVDDGTYNEAQMRADFGDRVVAIVKDVTKDDSKTDWHEQSQAYLDHLERLASNEAVIVSAADKIHNLLSTLSDYEIHGDDIWQRFTTNNSADQLWWYGAILQVIIKRNAPTALSNTLAQQVSVLKSKLATR